MPAKRISAPMIRKMCNHFDLELKSKITGSSDCYTRLGVNLLSSAPNLEILKDWWKRKGFNVAVIMEYGPGPNKGEENVNRIITLRSHVVKE